MKKEIFYELITGILVLLFLYTGLSKLLDFGNFSIAMRFQHLPDWMTTPLTYFLPISETVVAGLLIPDRSRLAGLYAFLVMMTCFTLYVGAAWLHLFSRVPCACGGVFKSLGWGAHFFLNFLFTGVALANARYYRSKHHSPTKQKPIKA
ncbi:methylamine utilization protein MauE [Mucilaginibacter oryzae]|uniref:Methylamine utilization protein MauE n=1 Tax=Mucilaginibacter oryzae TaxID=468058 RepID=A0A316H7C3_9SPHI|nr:MauE/DoxX family redox-associated membrane protein [Mucilaginibacter oryzae]PWK77049.1 methylamine utilization protein MauE [Mucilaginibacter oryzae]